MASKEEIATHVAEIIEKLPPIPSAILEIRTVIRDPNVNFSQVVPFLKKDPGLASDILKYANSARYGVSHTVDTLEQAVLYFGMSNLADFITAAFTQKIIKKAFSHLKGLDRYFMHSQHVAEACRVLSAEADRTEHDQDACSLIGLLHDIGKLVLTVVNDDDSLSLLGDHVDEMKELVEHENHLLGLNHCEVGAHICEKWNFPDSFHEGILRHHTPFDSDGVSPEGYLVFLAHIVGIGLDDDIVVSASKPDYLAEIHLTEDKIIKVNEELSELFRKERAKLGL